MSLRSGSDPALGWAAVRKAADSRLYSDMTIECGDDVHHVHRLVVCSQVEAFADAIEVEEEAGRQRKIIVQDYDREAVSALVEYLYLGEYGIPDNEDSSGLLYAAFRLPLHAKVYTLAEKLKVANLKDLSVHYFNATLKEDPDRVLSKPFQDAVDIAYASTTKDDPEIRPAIVNAIRRCPKAVEDELLQDFLRTHPDLNRELATSYQISGRDTAEYIPDPSHSTLYVANFPRDVDEDGLRDFFKDVGKVVNVRLPRDPTSGRHKGFAYVTFSSLEEARTALTEMRGTRIWDNSGPRMLTLDHADELPEHPSSPEPTPTPAGRTSSSGSPSSFPLRPK